uniref:Uncharacterized protein AlNc14C238G9425 n=1 Tax=Albugo laibachii Nc14 TaxID=890382 RepID=F0WSS9_9STRA|nr:conserved hypothetical protein [Albugo laibachii Nc14]|eukprot:CCA24407.1 conserved hypothetical protein [Albugo laibachii Nc14]
MDNPPPAPCATQDEDDSARLQPQSAAVSSIKSVIHKFSNKKKEKSNPVSSGFFSRGQKSTQKQPICQQHSMAASSMHQIYGGSFPPVLSAQSSVKSKAMLPCVPPKSPSELVIKRAMEPQGARQDSVSIIHDKKSLLSFSARVTSSRSASGGLRAEQLSQLFENDVIDLDKLRELSWGGIPQEYRSNAWKLLLGYMPTKKDRREAMIERKRQEYIDLLRQYYYIPDTDRGLKEQNTLRQILVDIPRTNADVPLFKNERIHQSMERILYIWAIRHPASGYVQGINDLLTPFLVVFLTTFVGKFIFISSIAITLTPTRTDKPLYAALDEFPEKSLQQVEADSYWCLTKLLDGIQDHYTFAQPGLQRMVQRMEDLVNRCDSNLYRHIVEKEAVQFVQFAFRWMNCLLMREIPLEAIVRVWDTYLCEDNGFESFHVYVCAAILMTFGEQLKEMEFQELVLFLQSLPTKDWTEEQIDPLLSRAFILQTYFADAPNHLN